MHIIFIHLNVNKKQGKLRQTLGREAACASPAERLYHDLGSFANLFSDRIWKHAKILLMGAILSSAERTVTAALCVMSLSMEKHFQSYHRVRSGSPFIALGKTLMETRF